MYLKEVLLENFKSFGRRVTIPLQQGYTVITGPNGSGKSNISDAILFVLGPKSSKVIRAGKLTDLVYNGGRSKNGAQHATVTLKFDNSDRMIPIDSDEVSLTRTVRISQEGEGYSSYFYVNDRKSSLTEFDFLLKEAKLSADGYNFVQQGDVTRIVEMGSVERRRIIDEIAGISAFDAEIEKAEKEREAVDLNISSAHSVLSELRKELDKLEEERKMAQLYLQEKKRLEDVKLTLCERRLAASEEEMAAIAEQISKYEKQIDQMNAAIVQRKQEISRFQERIASIDAELNKSGGEEARQLREKLDALKIERARSGDWGEDAKEQARELIENISGLKKKLKEGEDEFESLRSALDTRERLLAERSALLEGERKKLYELEKAIGEGDRKAAQLQQEIVLLNQQIDGADDRTKEMQLECDRISASIERQTETLASLEEEKKHLEFEYRDSKWQLKEINSGEKEREEEIRHLQQEFAELTNRERRLAEREDELEKIIKTYSREYERMKARREARNEGSLQQRALSAIMESRDRNELRGIFGAVSDLIEIEEQYREALLIAAGNRLNSVIVEDDSVAAACISLLKRNNLGRLTFLPLNKMLEGRPRGKAVMIKGQTLGFAIEHMKFDERFRAAMWYVFGDTLVVRTLDELRKLMGGIRLVTLDGEIAEAGGAITGGALERNNLQHASENMKFDEVAKRLREASTESDALLSELTSIREKIRDTEMHIKALRESGAEKSARLSLLLSKDSELERILNEKTLALSRLREDLGVAEEELKRKKEELRGIMNSSAEMRAKRDGIQKKLASRQPEEVAREMERLRNSISSLQKEVQDLAVSIETDRARSSVIAGYLNTMRDEIEKNGSRASELESRAEENRKRCEELNIEIAALERMERQIFNSQSKLREERDALVAQVASLDAECRSSGGRIETFRELIITQKAAMAASAEKRKELETELASLKAAGASAMTEELKTERLREMVAECEAKLGALGNVNMLAIENFEYTNQRAEKLKGEIEGLQEKKRALINLVEEINGRKRDGMMSVFESVNSNFKSIYSRLSGGSEGELVLENPEDPLQGGMVIRVEQRGKKSLRIEALSGGEKSLAALAFIFAIQQFAPSPVYFLDEVDMFLDGINSEAVARMVRGLSATAQFLQVSLRKVTLNSADRMIGVTKQATGISEVFIRDLPEMEASSEQLTGEAEG